MTDTLSLRPWMRVTFLGWLLGIVLVIAIAMVSELGGVRASQLPVGLGMGLGVGLAQERSLRPLLGDSHAWRWATAVGLAFPFFIVDLSRLVGMPVPYSLYAGIAVAGVTAGAGQAWVLRSHPIRAPLWILTSAVGWTAGSLMVAAADSLGNIPGLRGLGGALLYLTLVAMGGVFLGLTTSLPLRRLVTSSISPPPAA
jgi:hypothetical protein